MKYRLVLVLGLFLVSWQGAEAVGQERNGEPLPGTEPLTLEGDVASHLVAGVDRFLLGELDRSIAHRAQYWQLDKSSSDAYRESLKANRRRLAHILGVRDARVPFQSPQLMATAQRPALVARGEKCDVLAVRWPAFGDVHGEGLLLMPTSRKPIADVIAIPDADQTPEQIAGLVPGVEPSAQYALRLAESGCRVLVPVLISRELKPRGGRALLTNREYLYRSAFVLGRHLIGYEVQKVLAAVDWFDRQAGAPGRRIGVIGSGEGGLLALYAGALDPRIDVVAVSGYFDSRQNIWQEPIDRNVFGLLERFGDAELAAMIAPRKLLIEAAKGPELTLPGGGGAPARLVTPDPNDVKREVRRARKLVEGLDAAPACIELIESGDGHGPCGAPQTVASFLAGLSPDAQLAPLGKAPEVIWQEFAAEQRQERQIHEIDRHNQWLLRESPHVRREFMKKLDTSSLEAYRGSVAWYRQFFREEVIGRFDRQRMPPNVRTRKIEDREKWTSYEVVMDVFPEVIAYGILLLPKDIRPGERRPVVVCQHGLEGRPQQIVGGDHRAYHDFAAKLAERGFITFAPQNLYIFGDRFRTLQRKANPLGKTLFSVIVPQHQQITDWLASLGQVDAERIGFYGLSYGGKSAMRIPPLVDRYCLSICSADFNEWVWKNASTRSRYSYVWTGEYEIFEFDLGSTFNYAEMAALIAPRPFMVERGHFDGVAPDEMVGYEFAKVRFLYEAQLKLNDRCQIEWFTGPHTINGKGTFNFLHKHLRWPQKR